jgi:hypothetical protein
MKIRLFAPLSLVAAIVSSSNLYGADQPAPFLGKIPKRHSDPTNIAQKPRIIIITTPPNAPLQKSKSHDSLKHKELLANSVVKEKQIPMEEPGLPEAQLSKVSLDKEVFVKVMDIVMPIVIELNKQEIREQIKQRVIVYNGICTRYLEYMAWKNWNTKCIHVIEFIRGTHNENYEYPFIAGFLHTAEVSYLFDRNRLEIMHKGEHIKLRDIFPKDITQETVLMHPYKEREYEDKYGKRHIEENGGALDYKFRGKEYHSNPGSKWFF